MKRHYLDHNATAPVRPEVIDAVSEVMARSGNASSVHGEGRGVHSIVEASRETIRSFVNAPVNGLIFTSGGTEAIHLALTGGVKANAIKRIFVSAIEHSAVLENAKATGASVEIIPVTSSGVIDMEWFTDRLDGYDIDDEGAFIACVMLANNETGVIQPVRDVSDLVHNAGGLLFVDAAQAVGKVPVNFVMLGADMMSFTAHKFGGPLGIGALAIAPNLPLAPVFAGGGQEMNRRAGTINAPLISGFAKACELAVGTLENSQHIAGLRDGIENVVRERGGVIWGEGQLRLPGTLSFSVPGFSAETQLMALDLGGVAVSSGAACSSGKVKASHVLLAMGAGEEDAKCGIRVSLGWNSDQGDIDAFIKTWVPAYERVKERAA